MQVFKIVSDLENLALFLLAYAIRFRGWLKHCDLSYPGILAVNGAAHTHLTVDACPESFDMCRVNKTYDIVGLRQWGNLAAQVLCFRQQRPSQMQARHTQKHAVCTGNPKPRRTAAAATCMMLQAAW